MATPQLSVRSAKARDLAYQLARRENCTVADIVERALESYEIRGTGREPASSFYARMAMTDDDDIDLEAGVWAGRQVNHGVDL